MNPHHHRPGLPLLITEDITMDTITTIRRAPRSWPVLLLALPAFVAIWSGWVGLGSLTGFGTVNPLPGTPWADWTLDTAITLPIGVETYAAYALNVWLSGHAPQRATRFAKYSALGSLALGAAGQVTYHLMVAAGVVHAPWPITALVACLPVAVLGMGAALAHLVTETPYTETEPAADGVVVVAEEVPADEAQETAPQASAPVPAPGYRVGSDARVEPVDPTDDEDTAEVAVPAPRPAPRPAVSTPTGVVGARRGGRPAGSTAAVKVARLRAQHPDWKLAQIAERAGCSVRTARRYLNAPTAGQSGPDTAAAA